jgi:Fic family protein
MQTGLPICSRLVREAHARLLFWGRGADKTPGHFKTDQNYIIDRNGRQILFVPIDAQKLEPGIAKLEQYINDPEIDPLIQTAVSHLEFEALHPFRDGNGRIGRMLITLNLWDKKRIATPSFYISDCLEERRDEYIDRLRGVSATGEWTDWIEFFLTVVQRQSEKNLLITQSVLDLYNDMKGRFQHLLRSQWHIAALDYMFARGVFRNSAFTAKSGIPSQTAHRITKALLEAGILQTVVPAAGRRSALYAFKALLDVVR